MMRVEELSGVELDCFVAKALDPAEKVYQYDDGLGIRWHNKPKAYSSDWAHGGPVIESANLHLSPPTSRVHRNGGPSSGWGECGLWMACTWHKGENGRRASAWDEERPLVAAMRCFVISKLGPEVDIDQPNK